VERAAANFTKTAIMNHSATPLQQQPGAYEEIYEPSRPVQRSRFLRGAMIFLFLTGLVCALAWYLFVRPRHFIMNPLHTTPQLSAGFGELRSDHFHMGIDIRTGGRENLPVYAVEDGYISRVVVQPDGFGKALFVTHPNGYTSLYAHLNRFGDAVETVIRDQQYAAESWLQDVSFVAGRFPVSRGQLIAYSGNTGTSEGPHLHFEWRDTKTGKNLNPLLAGVAVADGIPPAIRGLYWYDRRYSTYETGPNIIAIDGEKGRYHAKRKVVKVTSPVVSFAIRAEDRMDDSRFKFGITSAEVRLDDSLVYAFSLTSLTYTDTRYVNACIDYGKYITAGIYIQHLCRLPGNNLPMFNKGTGTIHLQDSLPHAVDIKIMDAANNTTHLAFDVQVGQFDPFAHAYADGTTVLWPGRENKVTGKQVEVNFSAAALYDTVPFVLREQPVSGRNMASALITLHKSTVPVHDPYKVQVKTTLAERDPLRNRTVMQLKNFKKKVVVKGKWQGNYMCASFRQLGTVQLLTDTIAPQITALGWNNRDVFAGAMKTLRLACTDNLGSIARFRAELDGAWILFTQKGNEFTHVFDEHCKRGNHLLTIQATDVAGNVATERFSFVRE
jgi:murein DD-endopeptidase MepM/ murein hydrolase activator NlpD